ncbi:3-hydroxyacyl-CoA dehydrogenase [Halomonas sp. MCCC 1A17488]|uniref:3-hydroxyacyl-CoA dehydrogenase n=1 Tax=unclassified Halomonas TaxID=2609666 RepID=UPI0018D20966|nr:MULTISPECIES: 3-hydroxyacyl-CoA dehydrogenase [unclassified Halomonas]MCE8018413.1 3-hydroxyacyl-CoA dehydrogenase [Halomonas sp. MCCC 1A17488]MCG3241746.1 3-hydroxyacyl-CoA dehydrogenase [Halomonas sp. MCCC 1A17488]QPP49227.1 3-hydroxyacyl-CoA dehydrogenase [Halomonas sp. SS10-MC5]
MKFQDNTFIVTGGASGLGEATARALHDAGGNVVIADLNAERGEALAKELNARSATDRSLFQRTDVTSEADAQTVVALAVDTFGGLQGLVNCAGVGDPAKVVDRHGEPLPLEAFSRIVNINLLGSFNMLRLAAAAMAKGEPQADGERGVIINTASVAAFDGQIGQPAYAASKGGIVAMTLPIARELARHGIRVMTIAPGLFKTPLMEALPEEAQQSLAASIPFPNRLGEPGEFARLACHIVDNPMLNGETIRVDGAIRMAPR